MDRYRRQLYVELSRYGQHEEYRLLKSFFDWCVQQKLLLASPIRHWSSPKKITPSLRYLSQEQVQTILSAVNTDTNEGVRDRAILELLYATAIRRNELINLDLTDIDLAAGRLLIRHGKGNKDRVVPIIATSGKWLHQYLKDARPHLAKDLNPALFVGIKGKRISQESIYKLMRQLQEITQIKSIAPHTFRRSCATHLMQRGVPISYVQNLLGHRKLHSTQRYLYLPGIDLEQYDHAHPRSRWDIEKK